MKQQQTNRRGQADISVSVIVPSYSLDNYSNLLKTINSLLNQSYSNTKVIVVVHTSKELYKKTESYYSERDQVTIVFNKQGLSAAAARNCGIKVATGDILAFTDDDAIADNEWVEQLIKTYKEFNSIAVGGKIMPVWQPGKPDYFPEELYWLVGVTHKGFAGDKPVEVRNAFGPNMSFKKEVFDKVGLFNEQHGVMKHGVFQVQAEEAEFSLRMTDKLQRGVMYNPEAVVYHQIPASKARIILILRRSFFQGCTKVLLQKMLPSTDTISTEKSFLRDLLLRYIPQRMVRVFTGPDHVAQLKQLVVLFSCMLMVGFGFIYGTIRQYG